MGRDFQTTKLPDQPTVLAPDGAEVRVLAALDAGSCAHFRLPAFKTSKAVEHRTVEEVWYVTAGTGRMWRARGDRSEIVGLEPGLCLTIPLGTRFQFQSDPGVALEAVAITMPPWPGEDEAVFVDGYWPATVE